MVLTPEQYSRSATVDLETAISLAVVRTVDRDFTGPGGVGKIRFTQVHEDWPSFEDSFTTPAAAVLPGDELKYGPSHLTPVLLEDTWEVKGEPGLGLYELAEASREFQLEYRGSTSAERNALKAGVETAFVTDEVLVAPPGGARYGVLVAVPEYWGLNVRLSITGSSKLDDQELAAKNIWMGRATILAQAKLVKLAIVQPFRVRVTVVESTDPIP